MDADRSAGAANNAAGKGDNTRERATGDKASDASGREQEAAVLRKTYMGRPKMPFGMSAKLQATPPTILLIAGVNIFEKNAEPSHRSYNSNRSVHLS